MRRKRLIKATAWINVGILILALYTVKNIPENAIFATAAAGYSLMWLLSFAMANIGDPRLWEKKEGKRLDLTKIRTALAAVGIKKN